MKDLFSVFGFIGVLILFSFVAGAGRSPSAEIDSNTTSNTSLSGASETSETLVLTSEEAEYRVAELYDTLKELKASEREKKLWDTPSPYRDMVDLRTGDTGSKDPDAEYLVLSMGNTHSQSINISDWYLESYVTDNRVGIPQGDRVVEKWRSPKFEDIKVAPDEEVLLITGDSPIDVSFRENICTGYLTEEEDFIPQLSNQCPRPLDELEAYGLIRLDNDRCYEFIEGLGTCEIPDNNDIPGGRCATFVEDTFNYNDCVTLHKNDPFFTRDGYWYVYFGRSTNLWRSEREIIRLIDENNQVVDILEY